MIVHLNGWTPQKDQPLFNEFCLKWKLATSTADPNHNHYSWVETIRDMPIYTTDHRYFNYEYN